jgi:hypothetical protein
VSDNGTATIVSATVPHATFFTQEKKLIWSEKIPP